MRWMQFFSRWMWKFCEWQHRAFKLGHHYHAGSCLRFMLSQYIGPLYACPCWRWFLHLTGGIPSDAPGFAPKGRFYSHWPSGACFRGHLYRWDGVDMDKEFSVPEKHLCP